MKRILAIAMALSLLLGCSALAESTLNVTGSGTIYMEADLVTASLGVNMSGEDLETLQQEANTTIAAICDALIAAGLEEKNISTNYLYINPRYDYSESTERIIGYYVNNSMTIRTKEIDKIGAYIDAAFAAGANTFDSINFTVEDDSDARKEALTLAVQDAAAKAQVIATASGQQLGGIINISEGPQENYGWYNGSTGSVRYLSAATEDSVAGFGSSVRAAQVGISAEVQITYAMN